MSHIEFHHLLQTLPALSPEQVEQLKRELDAVAAQAHPGRQPAAPASDEELQRRLLAAGIISEIKPPIRDLAPYRNRQAVPILGEPLSETVLRDRR